MTTYLAYLDDSGDESHDILAALLVPVESWGGVIGYWKAFRRNMAKVWKFPPSVEFHSVEILHRGGVTELVDSVIDRELADAEHPGGRYGVYTYPSTSVLADGTTATREDLFVSAVTRLAEMNTGGRAFGVRLIVLFARRASGSAKLHALMLLRLQEFLVEDGSYAIVWSDGTDPAKESELRASHRRLDAHTRRILEDVVPRDSKHSHFIQMADVCAHAALRALRGEEGVETRRRLANAFGRLQQLIVQHPSNDGGGISHVATNE